MNELRIAFEEEREISREDAERKDKKIQELEKDCQEFSEEAFTLNQQLQTAHG